MKDNITIQMLHAGDAAQLQAVAEDVFDHAVDAPCAAEFLADSRHHLAVALDQNVIVGFVSAVHYVHPDKARPELWINEVAASPLRIKAWALRAG